MSNLIRYNPTKSIFSELERDFNQFFPFAAFNPNFNHWLPDVDIKEENDFYLVKADVPGMEKKDIKIHIDQYNNLIIEGERESEIKKEKKDYICFERSKGSFYRKIVLPGGVDEKNIKAKYQDGVLEITLHKAKNNIVKQIEIGD